MARIQKLRAPRWALLSGAALIAIVGVGACGDPDAKTKTQPGEVTTTTTAPAATSTTVKAATTTTAPAAATTTTVKATTTTTRLATTTTRPVSTVSFDNCTEAKAAGYQDIRRGQPGYGEHLDRDDDGIACES